jgi:signal transduction histidine kinase
VSLLVLGVYRLAFFEAAYYYLEPYIIQVSFILTAAWTWLFGLFDLTFFGLPEKQRTRIRNGIVVSSVLFIALVITNPLTGLLIGEVGPSGTSPGPLFSLTWAYTLGLSAWYSVMILKFVENRRTKTALLIFGIHTPLWFALDLLIGFERSGYASFTFLETFVSFLSVFAIFCFIYIENSRNLQEKEMALTQTRLNALQLQMNPHFMANALNALSMLTDTDPEAAKRMIADMSGYLRENFYDPDEKSLMIPFSDELEHLERYLAIERIRFPGINVYYWLEATDFAIPAMTLQPLVENAITHGLCKKEHSEGCIEIWSSETKEAYTIIIEDDGVGFDEKELSGESRGEEGKKHIGIPNTEKRLALMCAGRLAIHSTPGKGTVCEISIPKQGV